MKGNLKVNKRKIYPIGKQEGIKLSERDDNNNELNSWYIIKTLRRKNFLFCYGKYGDRIRLEFYNTKYAIKAKEQIEKEIVKIKKEK